MALSHSIYNSSEYQTSDKTDCTAAELTAPMRPTDNPYHWETSANQRSRSSSLVRTPRSRRNDVVQPREAVTLKRNSAVRRSSRKMTMSNIGTERVASNAPFAAIESGAGHHDSPFPGLRVYRRFSFEALERTRQTSVTLEEGDEEQVVPKVTTRAGSTAGRSTQRRSTRFREELDQPSDVPRTFSEMLGEPFRPTALTQGK